MSDSINALKRTCCGGLSNGKAKAVSEVMSSFGQENCINCGWSGGDFKDRSSVRFVDGDAVCPECGELCDYYDYRDEESLSLATKIANAMKSLGQISGDFAGAVETIREVIEAEKP